MKIEFQLSDAEFKRAWLTEYIRRPGLGLFRVMAGPVFITFGVQTFRAGDGFGQAMGAVAVLLGVWHLARPFVLVNAMLRQRRASGAASSTMVVDVDAIHGIHVSDGKKDTRLRWEAISAAGRGKDYVWFEIRGSARGTIPLRAVPDEAALVGIFRGKGKWTGP